MKILLFANTDWYLFNFRLSLAKTLQAQGHEVLLISPPGEYGARLQALGFRWEALPMDRKPCFADHPVADSLVSV